MCIRDSSCTRLNTLFLIDVYKRQVRFSASPHFNAEMEQIEWGIEPDIKVNMDEADETKHIDTIIEKARCV